ncbi:MAG: IS21 family transposase [Bacillota bacterium]
MERIQYITALREYEDLSLRAISEKTGHHFDTVKKYVEKDDWNAETKPRKMRESRLDALKPVIDEWLESDLKMPRKQRHTATKVYDRLSTEAEFKDKLLVGKQTVINYVSKAKKELGKSVYDTAILGYHVFGEAQLDFGEVYAFDAVGTLTKYYELVISFPASNGGYVQLCKSQNTECLLEGMQRIFEYMGKVPTRILFDNMSSAVVKILPKRGRQLTDTFTRFVLHHKFNAIFCNPNKGQEKGSVENKVGYQRRNFFVPVPTVTDLIQFNKDILTRCDEDMNREHYRKKDLICDLLVQDLEAMKPLPKQRFKVTRLAKVKTDKYSFVQFENNKYSTAPQYNRCEMWLEISAEELRILNDKYEEVVVHKRRYGQMPEPVVDWIKYLTAINRKPNAFKYTQFFKELPVVWQEYFNRADYDDSKKMLSTLTPIILDGKLDEATVALEVHEIQNADEFLLIYRNLTESPPPSAVKTQNTPTQLPYKNDLSVYGSLIGGEN